MRKSRILLATVTAVGLVGGGTAAAATLASTPIDGSGVIHGCYTKTATNGGSHTFVLRNAGTTCPSGTTAISWNKAGPAGPQGPQGLQGPQGSPGIAEGASGSTNPTTTSLSTPHTLVVVTSAAPVPDAGVYFVDASVMLIVGQGDYVACILADNGSTVGEFATVGPVANQTYETLPLVGSVSMSAGDVAQVQCTGYTGNSATSFYDGAVTATLINSATGNAAVRPSGSRPLPPPL